MKLKFAQASISIRVTYNNILVKTLLQESLKRIFASKALLAQTKLHSLKKLKVIRTLRPTFKTVNERYDMTPIAEVYCRTRGVCSMENCNNGYHNKQTITTVCLMGTSNKILQRDFIGNRKQVHE